MRAYLGPTLGQAQNPQAHAITTIQFLDKLRGSMIAGWPYFLLVLLLWVLQPALSRADEPRPADRVITIYPVTTGRAQSSDQPLSRIVVLSAQTGPSIDAAVAAAKEVFRRGGLTVLNETLQTLAPGRGEPQGPDSPDRSNADAGFLVIGKRAGADHVMLVEITDTLVVEDRARGGKAYLHDERVVVRGLSVHRGTVVLEGTARWSQPVERAGQHIRELTAYALARAICAPDKWVEASAPNNGRGRCRP